MEAGSLEVTGDVTPLSDLESLFDRFVRRFPIVTPRAG